MGMVYFYLPKMEYFGGELQCVDFKLYTYGHDMKHVSVTSTLRVQLIQIKIHKT